jgi:hypothetical protein
VKTRHLISAAAGLIATVGILLSVGIVIGIRSNGVENSGLCRNLREICLASGDVEVGQVGETGGHDRTA